MDFLKKHFEKVFLAAALLALIVSVVWLTVRIDALKAKVQGEIRRTNITGGPVKAVDVVPYERAIHALAQPVVWTNMADSFVTAAAPGETNIDIRPPSDTGPKLSLRAIEYKPFSLLFKTYSGKGYNFQLNFRGRSFIITAPGDFIKDQFENTGYKIVKFEQKTVTVQDKQLGIFREDDVSELTIQHGKEEPKTLVLRRVAREKEPVARISCPDWPAGEGEVHRGQKVSCGGKTYNVVDITSDRMLIIDPQSEEEQTLHLPLGR